jgi:hypothetical protein
MLMIAEKIPMPRKAERQARSAAFTSTAPEFGCLIYSAPEERALSRPVGSEHAIYLNV